MPAGPPPILPYADASIPFGLDGVQIVRVHDDVRRVIVPCGLSLEITPYAFRLVTAGPLGVRTSTWPRSAVTGVHVNRFNNAVAIEFAGHGPLQLDVGTDRAMAERVMHEFTASLTVIPVSPAHRQMLADYPGATPPPSPARSALFIAAAALGAASIALMWLVCPPVWACGAGVAAIGLVGVAFGTQRKDFWV